MLNLQALEETLWKELPAAYHADIPRLIAALQEAIREMRDNPVSKTWSIPDARLRDIVRLLYGQTLAADNALIDVGGGERRYTGVVTIRQQLTSHRKRTTAAQENIPTMRLHITLPRADRAVQPSWGIFRQAARALTAQNMIDAQSKYWPQLYQQRATADSALNEFLTGDATCLVLTGRSGVGKTNYLMDLADRFAIERPNGCVMLFNGAALDLQRPLQDSLTERLVDHLANLGCEVRANDLWAVIEQIFATEGRHLIIGFDAINEHVDATALLRTIDAGLVSNAAPAWLKIVITSRPETWHRLQREILLGISHYYRAPDQSALGIELEQFTYTEELQPFSNVELPLVYAKYQGAFELRTAYEKITPQVRSVLSDPLLLLIVSDIYAGSTLPDAIDPDMIFEHYFQHLIETQRLASNDRHFLQAELVPLMLADGTYLNTLTRRQIADADLAAGTDIGQRIYGGVESVQAYINLSDNAILTHYDYTSDGRIGFVYERFYDYFGGLRIRELIRQKHEAEATPRDEQYASMAARINDHAYLWGAVRYALAAEWREQPNNDLLLGLSVRSEQIIKEMLVQIIAEYGKIERQGAEQLAMVLMRYHPQQTAQTTRAVWQMTRLNPCKVAIEVARELGFNDVLVRASIHRVPAIRRHAAQHICYYWDKHPKSAFKVLYDVMAELRPLARPWKIAATLRALDTSARITSYIFFKNYHFSESEDQLGHVRTLQQLWQPVLRYILAIDTDRSQDVVVRRRVSFIFEFIIERFISLVFTLLKSLPYSSSVNPRELDTFFRLSVAQKQRVRLIVQLLDPDQPADLAAALGNLEQAARDGDPMTAFLVEHGLLAQDLLGKNDTLPIMQRLYEIGMQAQGGTHIGTALRHAPFGLAGAMERRLGAHNKGERPLKIFSSARFRQLHARRPPNVFAGAMIHAAYVLAEHLDGEAGEQAFKCYCAMVERYYREVVGLRLRGHHGLYVASNLAGYARLHHQRQLPFSSELIAVCRQKMDVLGDEGFTIQMLYDIGTIVGSHDPQDCRAGLALLHEFRDILFPKNEQRLAPRIQDEAINLLAKVRNHHPGEIERFLEQLELTQHFQARLEAKEIRESEAETLIAFSLPMQLEGLRSPDIRRQFLWATEAALTSQSLKEWARIIARGIINLAYGRAVFPLGQPDLDV